MSSVEEEPPRERPVSHDQIKLTEGGKEYVVKAPKPSAIEALTKELAPYVPAGSDKESAFFKTTARGEQERIIQNTKKGYVDVDYKPRHTITKKKPIFYAKMEQAMTTSRRKMKTLGLCSKGTKECRSSNSRATGQLIRLANLSPRLDE